MAINVQLNEDALLHLASYQFSDWKVSPMSVAVIGETNVQTAENDAAYLFMCDAGKIFFRKINGIYQASSFPDGNVRSVIDRFVDICEVYDLTYTAVGFEPSY